MAIRVSVFFVQFIIMLLCIIDASQYEKKRILLNDPSYIQQQLNHLQTQIQDLRVTVNSQQTTISTQKSKITLLEATVASLSPSTNGAVYVRWGRKDCPSNNYTEMVYSGFVGGPRYNVAGGASNAICLPPDPSWGSKKDIPEHMNSYIYGAEYEDIILFNMPDMKQDMPCAVCRSSGHSTAILVAGRVDCHSTWTEAYQGNLAASFDGHSGGTQYVCIDENPQAILGGGNTNDDECLFYGVKTRCGSLPCPPYEDNKQLACVMCIK